MSALSLYELNDAILSIVEMLGNPDITDEDARKALSDALAVSEEQVGMRLDHLARAVRQAEAQSVMFKGEAKHFQDKARVAENTAARIKSYVKEFLEGRGQAKFVAGCHTWAIQANGGKQAITMPDDPCALPADYQRAVIEADTDRIREALEDGQVVPGCELLPRGTHVRVR